MSVIIISPRSVIRQVLDEPLQRAKLPAHILTKVDAILVKSDSDWSHLEFHYLWHVGSLCDE